MLILDPRPLPIDVLVRALQKLLKANSKGGASPLLLTDSLYVAKKKLVKPCRSAKRPVSLKIFKKSAVLEYVYLAYQAHSFTVSDLLLTLSRLSDEGVPNVWVDVLCLDHFAFSNFTLPAQYKGFKSDLNAIIQASSRVYILRGCNVARTFKCFHLAFQVKQAQELSFYWPSVEAQHSFLAALVEKRRLKPQVFQFTSLSSLDKGA